MDPTKTNTPPKPRPVAGRIVTGLFRSRNYVWDNDHRIVAEHGLTWSQFLTLLALRDAGPERRLSPTELYEAAQVSSGGMTKMLHALTDAGLVTRPKSATDKRSTLVQITPKGGALCDRLVQALLKTNTALFTGILDPQECEALATLLQKLARGLHDQKSAPK